MQASNSVVGRAHGREHVQQMTSAAGRSSVVGSNNSMMRRVFSGIPITPELFQGLLGYTTDSEWVVQHVAQKA